MERSKKIIRVSLLGILVNLALVLFKATVGLLSGSIAIILDAVNNLSDALSSVITIVGTKLAGKAPDKKHPYGHGRVEYLTSLLIALIVLIAGVTSVKESVVKIITPVKAEYSAVMIIIIVAAIFTKFLMGQYVKNVGKSINAGPLIASGADALFDAVLSAGTLAAALCSILWGLSLEGVFGAIISLFILKAGIEMLTETLNSIIGTRVENDLTDHLKAKINSYPGVLGTYDLMLHNYGPTLLMGSAHIELPDDTTAKEIHKLTRTISTDVYTEFGIILTIGIYATNDDSEESKAVKQAVEEIVGQYSQVLQMHGFYLDEKNVTFDLIIAFGNPAEQIRDEILEKVKARCPEYTFHIVLDSDYSE